MGDPQTFEFTIPLRVLPKHDGEGVSREYDGRGGVSVVHYRPKNKKANQRAIERFAAPYAPPEPLAGPIQLSLIFDFPPSKGSLIGDPHISTPDLTALLKQVEDAFEGLFYRNDRSVFCQHTWKRYSDAARVHVRIEQGGEPNVRAGGSGPSRLTVV